MTATKRVTHNDITTLTTMSRQIEVLDNPIINKIKEGSPNHQDTIGSLLVNPPGCVLSNLYLKYKDKIQDFQVREDDIWIISFPKAEANPETCSQAFLLDSATSSVVFILCLKIISRYSSYLEPVVNKLQSVDFDLHSVHRHIKKELMEVFLMEELSQFYDIKNLKAEARTWYGFWKNKDYGEIVMLSDLLSETAFFPSVKRALLNYMTIPPTTCSVERSFSTLRRVKTCLRSTLSQERLSRLYLLSVHRDRVKKL
ncbi:unnamed protein product [Timema podura]|uniref:HAT C-terminal dimerisation domain-containing protein n=1 Tax=Timema podura TaxID=61482 RepID=A0ABN7NWL4_TIMPD|nr:unnamed protein product [Timema podura]